MVGSDARYVVDHTEFDVLKCSPADVITAVRNERDSACPADGFGLRLHHIRGRGHGS
jgi:hypothetical protein